MMKKMKLAAVVVMLTMVTAVSAQVNFGIKGGGKYVESGL